MTTRPPRDTYLSVRLTAREREKLREAAARDDLDVSELVRDAIRETIRRRSAERAAAGE